MFCFLMIFYLLCRLTQEDVIWHYTQVVWAKTTHIGCGLAVSNPTKGFTTTIVCNYGKAGNHENKPLYQVGPAGSACPKGTKNEDGLCASIS